MCACVCVCICVCAHTKVCVRVCFLRTRSRIEVFHWLGSARIHTHTHTYTDRHSTHRGDSGTACRGHVEVCAAVAQPESRSAASSTSALPARRDQIPGSQLPHIEAPLRGPKCKSRARKSQKHTSEKGGQREGGRHPAACRVVRALSGDFGAFIS